MRHTFWVTIGVGAMLLVACGRHGVEPGPTSGPTANAVLKKTNPLALAVDPKARFYLLVGHQIDGDGASDPDKNGYWVANYMTPDASSARQVTILAYKVTADGEPTLTRREHAAIPSGYGSMAPKVPGADSSKMVLTARKSGKFQGVDVPVVKLYSPLTSQYWGKLLYYVGDTPPDMVVLDADTAAIAP
jgi:hypothetical protein